MASQYITVPLNTNVKYWALKWFYIRQVEPYVACDVDQILVSDPRWSERTNSNGIEQVRELLVLINCKGSMESLWQQTSPWRIQPCKQRAHPEFEF
jgi:hypothetical protein